MKYKQNEQRMMWLMVLIMVGITAWFFDIQIISYLCAFACMISVMQYVDGIEKPVQSLALKQQKNRVLTSKVPLYLASIIIFFGVFSASHFLTGIGVAVWMFFFLRWLQRLEQRLVDLQQLVLIDETLTVSSNEQVALRSVEDEKSPHFIAQIQNWVFQGNPVLKAATLILIIGVILLLRFASEHWQLGLGVKLLAFSALSISIVAIGYRLAAKKRGFALAVQGLGLASLVLILFFAHDQRLLVGLSSSLILFILLQLAMITLSVKQNSIELALMSVLVAYLAPFAVVSAQITALQLLGYYLAVNLVVAIMTSLRAWKMLNQIAFLVTTLIGLSYVLIHADLELNRWALSGFTIVHSLLFIFLGLRFSHLIALADLKAFKLRPIFDVVLVYIVPITAFILLYFLHFNDRFWQVSASLFYAALAALCWYVAKRLQSLSLIADSYLSVSLIFLALIVPLSLVEQWSVWGWAIVGTSLYLWSLVMRSNMVLYLAQGLLLVAGGAALYYGVIIDPWPESIFWVVCVSYLIVLIASFWKVQHRDMLGQSTMIVLSALGLFTSITLYSLIQNQVQQQALSLLCVVMICVVLNELILSRDQGYAWLIPKWSMTSPLLLLSLWLLLQGYHQSTFVWSMTERLLIALAGILQAGLWLRPLANISIEKEWMSFGVLVSLSTASLALFPQQPYLSVIILPLVFCFWCYFQSNAQWAFFWQSKVSLGLMLMWMILSQLNAQNVFFGYFIPIFNPFDVLSIGMLLGLIWVLSQQLRAGRDQGLVAVCMVIGLLWLSSHIVLRGLHFYLDTPYLGAAVWQNASVQMALTVLWVCLAWIIMWSASARQLKALWILGSSILVLVSLKLVLFDLSHIGTFTRVISFLVAGGAMLLIAYLAPMPESQIMQNKN